MNHFFVWHFYCYVSRAFSRNIKFFSNLTKLSEKYLLSIGSKAMKKETLKNVKYLGKLHTII